MVCQCQIKVSTFIIKYHQVSTFIIKYQHLLTLVDAVTLFLFAKTVNSLV